MRSECSELFFQIAAPSGGEDGQDLAEYSLPTACICIAAVAGTHKLATAITTTFTNIGTSIA